MFCNKCMNEIPNGTFCEKCMYENTRDNISHHLKPGTLLNGKYLVGNAIGEGGFGITYIGRDITLDIKVAIKEYFPNGYANRNHSISNVISTTTENQKDFFYKGKARFLMEARSLAKFNQEKGIVDILSYFEENSTAYIIMEYLEGMTLSDYIKLNGVMKPTDIFTLMKPVMHSLQKIHNKGIIHRDISPDNIMYLSDGTLKLMDFGSARYFLNQNATMSVVLKMGYAPEEQYRKNGHQGPWTDVYSMCATIYRCITGKTPDSALDRLYKDNIKPPSQLGINIPTSLEIVLMHGLAVHKENRFQSMESLINNIDLAIDLKDNPKETYKTQKNKYNSWTTDDFYSYRPNESVKETYSKNDNFDYIKMDSDSKNYLFRILKKNLDLILGGCLFVIFMLTLFISSCVY